MPIQAVRAYVSRLWDQYQVAGRRLRSIVLDELVRNLEIHRKSATRLMRAKAAPRLRRGSGPRRSVYQDDVIVLLKRVWREMGYCGSKVSAS